MSSRWYYQMLMEEFGPVTVEQLRELFNDGTLGDADLVRSEVDDVWTPLAAVKQSLFTGSVDRLEPAMEEIGDLSELAFEFEDSGPTARRGAYTQESPPEAIQESPPVAKTPVSGSVVQSPNPVAAVPVPPVASPPVASPRVPPPQPPANDQPVDEWFCESLGQVMGPMSFEELIELGESGALDANDRVRCGERGIWKTVDCLPRVMRAVAVGRAIQVDPAVVSSTTQKRLGDAAVAAMANPTEAPNEPVAEEPLPPQIQKQPVAVPEKSTAGKPPRKTRKNAKGEEELLDEIFDDVFNDASPPAKTTTVAQSMTASSATAATASSKNTPPPPPMRPPIPAAPAYSSPAYSPPASQDSSRAAGARLTAAAMASRSSTKSSGSSFEANPATIGILVAVMLVAAGGWYVWQYGIPGGSSSGNGNGTFDREGSVKILKAAMDRYKALGDSPSESEWNDFSMKTSKEMSTLFNSVYTQAGATPNGAACLAATMCVMKIAKTQPDNKEFIDKNLVEFERQIVLVTK
ncbi:MAG: DUF4339 domain-containing protein [Fuerstia sp.]|nr:DUF4339 domain-containing protein [Fuerstiella sp.]